MGQPDSEPVMGDGVLRMNLGLGGGGIGLGFGASLEFEIGGHLVVLDGVYIHGLNLFASRESESIGTIGLLYGRAWRRPSIIYTVAAGLAYAAGRAHAEDWTEVHQGGTLDERYTDHDFSTVGVPLRGELIVRISSWIGAGVGLYANLNAQRSVGGGMLLLSIGTL